MLWTQCGGCVCLCVCACVIYFNVCLTRVDDVNLLIIIIYIWRIPQAREKHRSSSCIVDAQRLHACVSPSVKRTWAEFNLPYIYV